MNNDYKICNRCVMDTSDSFITFDDAGVCSHCLNFDLNTATGWFPDAIGKIKLEQICARIREEGAGKEYDCIIGLSGGLDSSYLAVLLKDYGLRPLAVHVDAGWNSELAVNNIEQVIKFCEWELHTHVMDWEEIKDLQLSYLKSGVANQDVVQDHAFFAVLYKFAVQNNIKYVISGGNIATESIEPNSWEHSAMDAKNLKAIHSKYGKRPLRDYRTISFFNYYINYPIIRKMKVIRPLNFVPYGKSLALQSLKASVGYKDYGRKHGESRFTKFYQDYYLPTKFGIDKRRSTLSSRVLSGEISREEALLDLEHQLYLNEELDEDKSYIAKKLGISVQELDQLIDSPTRHYSEFPNWDIEHKLLKFLQRTINKIFSINIGNYS